MDIFPPTPWILILMVLFEPRKMVVRMRVKEEKES